MSETDGGGQMRGRWTVGLTVLAAVGVWLAARAPFPPEAGLAEVVEPAAEPLADCPPPLQCAQAHCDESQTVSSGVRTVTKPTAPAPITGDLPRSAHPLLLDPAVEMPDAPERYRVRFQTTEGDFVVEVREAWAPIGAQRLHDLVTAGFYDHTAFFRVIDGFVAQWGVHPAPEVNAVWRDQRLVDDRVVGSNTRGTVVFATSGQNSRTTQLYVNLIDNLNLDKMGFAPVGEVVEGMDVVDALYSDYGEGEPRGRGPAQGTLQSRGGAYVAEFPELDLIRRATVIAHP